MQTTKKLFKPRRMFGKLTTADAAYEAVPKDIVKRRCPRRPPRRLCQGKMPRKPCPREFAKKAAPKDATKEAAHKKSTKNGVPNTLPEPWPPWWDGQQGPAQPGTGQHHQHKVHKAEQPEAEKPKVEQPKGQLEVEQHHPEPQTKAKQGGRDAILAAATGRTCPSDLPEPPELLVLCDLFESHILHSFYRI